MEKKPNLIGSLYGFRRDTVVALLIAAFAAIQFVQPAVAQRVVGGRGLPSVVIDYSVLDSLGPAPNVPELLKSRNGFGTSPRGFTRGFSTGRGRGLQVPPLGDGPRFPLVSGGRAEAGPGRIILKRPTRKTRKRTVKRSRKQARRSATKPVKREAARKRVSRKPLPPVITKPPPPVAIAPLPPAVPAPKPPALPKAAPPRMATPATRAPLPPPAAPAPAPAVKPPPMVKQASRPAAPPKASSAASSRAQKRSKPQTAALPPSPSKVGAGGSLRLKFGAGSAKLNADATRKLKSVAEAMSEDAKLRLQLLAYAGGSSQGASRARRLSLSRALSARSFLIGAGVRSTRIDVRALGNKSDGGPPDRIDVIVTKR